MKNFRKCTHLLLCTFIFINSVFSPIFTQTANAEEANSSADTATTPDYYWPAAPDVASGSAILIEATTGTVLYEKDAHAINYPASITKIMTALLAIENCNMDDVITFSSDAVYSVDPLEDAHISLDVGEQLTVDQTLHAILMKSANEASYGMAEYVSGSVDEFANLMNTRALELGALNTHFANASGLEDPDHYTTAYDMAMIGRACFASEKFMNIVSYSGTYIIGPTNMKTETRYFYNKYKLLPGREKEYAYSLGGKPGWTTISGNTLVSFAEKDGMKLIVCVMKSTLNDIYDDTTNLFEYGFNNFKTMNISDNESKYTLTETSFFNTTSNLFEHTSISLALNDSSYIIIPSNAQFSDTVSTITYTNTNPDATAASQEIASIQYTYNGTAVGSTTLNLINTTEGSFDFGAEPVSDIGGTGITNKNYLKVNIRLIVILVLVLCFMIFIITYNVMLRRARYKRSYRYRNMRKKRY